MIPFSSIPRWEKILNSIGDIHTQLSTEILQQSAACDKSPYSSIRPMWLAGDRRLFIALKSDITLST